ncbi:unnamed protein product [Amaranthus hypochondriacus]
MSICLYTRAREAQSSIPRCWKNRGGTNSSSSATFDETAPSLASASITSAPSPSTGLMMDQSQPSTPHSAQVGRWDQHGGPILTTITPLMTSRPSLKHL